MSMNKLEALKYVCENYHGSQGGFQMACLVEIIMEDKETYSKQELDSLIKNMTDY